MTPRAAPLSPAPRACAVCGKELRAYNETGRCYLCQKARRCPSPRLCTGCGAPLSERNRSGMCRACFGEHTRRKLAGEAPTTGSSNVETAR